MDCLSRLSSSIYPGYTLGHRERPFNTTPTDVSHSTEQPEIVQTPSKTVNCLFLDVNSCIKLYTTHKTERTRRHQMDRLIGTVTSLGFQELQSAGWHSIVTSQAQVDLITTLSNPITARRTDKTCPQALKRTPRSSYTNKANNFKRGQIGSFRHHQLTLAVHVVYGYVSILWHSF